MAVPPSTPNRGGSSSRDGRAARRRRLGAVRLAEGAREVSRRDRWPSGDGGRCVTSARRFSPSGRRMTRARFRSRSSTTARTSARGVRRRRRTARVGLRDVRRPARRLSTGDARTPARSPRRARGYSDRPSTGRLHAVDGRAARGAHHARRAHAAWSQCERPRGRRVPPREREYARQTSSSRRASGSTRNSPIARSARRTRTPCSDLATDFWATALWAARRLRKGDVFRSVDAVNGALKRSVVTLLGWHALSVDPTAPVLEAGRGLERWADPGALSSLELAYAHYDLRDAARALWETVDLFQGIEEETARRLGLEVELDVEELRRQIQAVVRDPRPGATAMAVRRLLPMLLVAVASSWPGAAATRRARRPRPRPRRTLCASTSSATGRCGPSVARSRRQAFSSSTTS